MSDKAIPVRVAVRIRPLVPKEITEGSQHFISKVIDQPQVTVKGSSEAFTYDYVFGPDENQSQVYDTAVTKIVGKIFKGYNVTILAYGQTGSGKTFSMGTADTASASSATLSQSSGIIQRAVKDLFRKMNEDGNLSFEINVSFLELYMEKVYDLLSKTRNEEVEIREDPKIGIRINGLNETAVTTWEETLKCLENGSLNRRTGATAMNHQSSRSHAIFTLTINQIYKESSSTIKTSKFHLVDLAGSERASKTHAVGERFAEGVNINKGLLSLGNVISALCENNPRHIPYRDSKLTRLLQDSLGGNSHTLMIACVSPADSNCEETLSTLRYADRARKIKNKPVVNQDPTMVVVTALRAQVQQLLSSQTSSFAEVEQLRQQLKFAEEEKVELIHAFQMASEENLGQDPNAIKENYNAKQKLTQVEQELLEMQKFNSDAQSRIASLTEELRQFKESAVPVPEASVKGDDDRHNSSLIGMCMADELRDVFMNQDCSFAPRSINRTRKRPSSILSVALAKMDQSVCMLDSTEHEMEPSKKTRLSIQSDVSEELDISEVKEIREYFVELQSVLVRYEADYEILSQEKEQLNSQLLNAQTEIESLREEKNKVEPVGRLQDEENFSKKSDTSEEMLDSSCFVGEPSISTSVIDMEQSCESDDQFLSLRDQFTDTRGSSISTEISEAAAQRKEKVEHSNKIKQLEEESVQLNERLELLQQDVEEKTSALEEKQRSIEAAQSTIEVLEQRDGERQNLLSILDKLNEKMRLLSEDSTLVTKELETTRQTLEEIRAEARALFVAKELLESRLEKANEELEATRTVLLDSADRVAPPSQVDQEANVRYEKTLDDLNLAHDRVKALESELELKTTELNAALNAIQQARSKVDELEESYVEKNQLEELVEKLTSQLDDLQDDLDLKIQELNEVQGAKQEVLLRNEVLDADVDQKKLEINQAQAELVDVRLKLEATGAELERAKQDLQESCARTEELVRMNEQLESEKKDAVASKETIEEELRINADAALEKARLSMDAVHRNYSEVHALQDSLDKTRAQAQHLQSSNEELLSELNLTKTKIGDLYNDLQSANAALSALNEEAASRNQDYSAELNRKTQAIQQLDAVQRAAAEAAAAVAEKPVGKQQKNKQPQRKRKRHSTGNCCRCKKGDCGRNTKCGCRLYGRVCKDKCDCTKMQRKCENKGQQPSSPPSSRGRRQVVVRRRCGSSSHPASRQDIEVTGQEAATGLMVDHLHLQVRRGSEPALNRISPDAPSTMPNTTGSSSSSA